MMPGPQRRAPLERFLQQVKIAANGCWVWTGYIMPSGYAYFCRGGYNGPKVYVHRFAYETWLGPLPNGLCIDHKCHNADHSCIGGRGCLHRRCVNPDHLEAVTNASNLERGRGNKARTHCRRGHVLNDINTFVAKRVLPSKKSPLRFCKVCHNVNERRKWQAAHPQIQRRRKSVELPITD